MGSDLEVSAATNYELFVLIVLAIAIGLLGLCWLALMWSDGQDDDGKGHRY